MQRVESKPALRSEQLLDVLGAYEDVLIVAHDNPDPDAIAAGWALVCLVQERLHLPVRMVAGGAIVRAENRHMVDLLEPPIELERDIEVSEATAVVLIDCEESTTNQLATRAGVRPTAVIDHHAELHAPGGAAFRDIRTEVAAAATIVTAYLCEQGVEPGPKLATALVYAIRTETKGGATGHTDLDRAMLLWLTERAEHEWLAEIECAPLAREYFSDLLLALQSTYLYGDAAWCFLPCAHGAEIVGEVADLLIRCGGVRRVLCGAAIGNDVFVSVRTQTRTDSAVRLLVNSLSKLGGAGGGHLQRAGGKIPGVARDGRIDPRLKDQLRGQWLTTCGGEPGHGTPLIGRRDIIENL